MGVTNDLRIRLFSAGTIRAQAPEEEMSGANIRNLIDNKIHIFSSEGQSARAYALIQAAENLLIEAADLLACADQDAAAHRCGVLRDAIAKEMKQ
jgi:hypothetical protein